MAAELQKLFRFRVAYGQPLTPPPGYGKTQQVHEDRRGDAGWLGPGSSARAPRAPGSTQRYPQTAAGPVGPRRAPVAFTPGTCLPARGHLQTPLALKNFPCKNEPLSASVGLVSSFAEW